MSDSKTLIQLRTLLERIVAGKNVSKEAAAKALETLNHLDESSNGYGVKVFRGGAEVFYVVEKSANGETLAERRTGKAQPFRCPKPLYDAIIKVMSKAERAMPLDEIVAEVAELFGEHPPDFQVRVPLRLWMQVQPPLLGRNRARYRPAASDTFASKADELWASLRTK